MSAGRKQVSAYLDELHHAFEAKWNAATPGWGQFLDGPPGNVQVGRYGTSAGAIVLRLAGQQDSQTANRVFDALVSWAFGDNSDLAVEHRVQTIPLAMLTIGIGYLRPNAAELAAARAKLFQRRLSTAGLWGDYWIDDDNHAERPSLFVSAIVLIACHLTQTSGHADPRAVDAARRLQEHYLRNPDKYVDSDPIISVAIVLLLGSDADSAVLKDLRRFALKPSDIARRYNYFYDYRRPNGTWNREYFIVPLDLIAMLVLRCRHAPASAKLKARAIDESLRQRLDSVGSLKLADGDRLSTLEHGCAALAFEAVHIDENSPSSFGLSGMSYRIRRERPSWEKIGSWMVLGAYGLLGLNYAAITLWDLSLDGVYQVLLGSSAFALGVVREPVGAVRAAFGMSK
jgi:hypothetical protein